MIARLAKLCQTAAGKALAEALEPSREYAEALYRQRLTAEGRRLLEMKPNLSLGGVRDVGTLVQQARLGHTLEPSELLDVQSTLSAAQYAADVVTGLRAYIPFLAEIADRIADFREIVSMVARAIDGRGEVIDTASPLLAELRRESRIAHDRLTSRLQQILNSARACVQEPIVTLRDGRYVIPVKAEMRAQLPGIVHDVSSSGATVFLEPLEIVEMGNRWRELLAEEAREIARILRQMSQAVGERAADIAVAIQALAEIDLSLAKARLGEEMGAREIPHDGADQRWLLEEPNGIILLNARHPLLKGEAVPITVYMGTGARELREARFAAAPDAEFQILLITGPNTGGKTVALKTIGLLSLMAAAGLPVPAARDSRIPVFDSVFADIGDEQSIEQSLSTFSSHIGNIVSILRSATRRSLVLLDELAAGTDPAEGAALAKAILGHLLTTGCLTVATTHHGELKAFAHVQEGIANASVEFDAETLSPTYRLHIGLPGQSNALAIAERLGMPEQVLEGARLELGADRIAVEALITDLHRHREEAASASEAQKAAQREAELARERVSRELQALEANRDRLIERIQREMESELSQARARLRQAMKELERAERLSVFERAEAIKRAQQQVAAVEESAKAVQRRRRPKRRGPLPAIEPGDHVFLRDLPTPGEAITAPDDDGELDVQLGALRARVNVRQIDHVEKGRPTAERRYAHDVAPSARPIPSMPPELDLRGLTVEEALMLMEQRLDEAARAGVGELRIIHGKGTGALRRAVREALSRHALVASHEPAAQRAGGDGVTVVILAT